MKILQQILSDLYVDPDLLAELDEEQRQVLFFKMRQEQVRRYTEREKTTDARPRKPPRPGRRQVRIIQDGRGDPWVWVMGEHKNDLSIELLIERDLLKKAEDAAELQAGEDIAELDLNCNTGTKAIELCRQQLKALEHECSNVNNTVFKEFSQTNRKSHPRSVVPNKRKDSVQEIDNARQMFSSALFSSLKEAHRKKIEDEDDTTSMETNWREQERKSKEKEAETKETMIKVRRFISQNSVESSLDDIDESMIAIKQWPAKPSSREDAVKWFIESERLQNAGIDPTTEKPYDWLHGIISRQRAEFLLFPKPEGNFLIRVSDRVRGYVLSYRAKQKCKHYLIDATITQKTPSLASKYTFLGGDQREHNSLRLLVDYHHTNKITEEGERLLTSCGQLTDAEIPDYAELFI